MPVKVWPDRTEVLHAAVLPSGANAPDGLALAIARVKAGAVRANANGLRGSLGLAEASVVFT
jgi:hypothetical protein